MNRNIRIFISLLLSALLLAGISGCSGFDDAENTNDNLLRVGLRADVTGLSIYNETTGMFYGLEAELADALAERMGYSGAEYVGVRTDEREEKLLGGDIDLLLAGYSIYEDREQIVDFTSPYFTCETYVAVERTSLITEMQDLAGMMIGAVTDGNDGVLFQLKMEELGLDKTADGESAYTLLYFDTYDQLMDALEVGEIDAAIIAIVYQGDYDNGERISIGDPLGEQVFGAATIKDGDLSAPAAEAMQSLLDDGTIRQMIDKWEFNWED